MLGRTFSISLGMRTANLSLRVGCFDDVDTNRVDKRASLEEEGDCRKSQETKEGRRGGVESYQVSENGVVHSRWSGKGWRDSERRLTAAKTNESLVSTT
jgi:hypothetical protein